MCIKENKMLYVCNISQSNSTIDTLDLSDNDIGPLGAKYIADALKENTFIQNLVGFI